MKTGTINLIGPTKKETATTITIIMILIIQP
jgi:hypothetical protein